jgi:hypothetical protein
MNLPFYAEPEVVVSQTVWKTTTTIIIKTKETTTTILIFTLTITIILLNSTTTSIITTTITLCNKKAAKQQPRKVSLSKNNSGRDSFLTVEPNSHQNQTTKKNLKSMN